MPPASRRAAPKGKRTVADLAAWLGQDEAKLRAFEPSYRVAHIPKRSGGRRTLHIPDAPTMELQRRIAARLLRPIPAHPAATAYEPGASPVRNALPHSWQAVVVKLDIVDFFPSTSDQRIERWWRWIGWDEEASRLLTRLVTHEGGLPQGAPTSPPLCNRVNRGLDRELESAAARWHGSYTRYADDISFSFPLDYPKHVRGVITATRHAVARRGYKLHTTQKRRVLRHHEQQLVTGLVVNDGPQLTRERRRWLRAVRHAAATQQATSIDAKQLKGWTCWESQAKLLRQQAREEATLAILQAIADHASLTDAAHALHLSRPALLARAKRLGVPLG